MTDGRDPENVLQLLKKNAIIIEKLTGGMSHGQ
jgi:hypothetical protein